ncbi:unnamed protein product [Protopolystoma xenopodis]|uniref:Uncharacterized protein n=1 Tax=Protopolystoma xenopodis TaxID=117903 RepID=A0A448X4W2_9PLAT|nr:unnamed protein product [Protopolystoma xenopodis]
MIMHTMGSGQGELLWVFLPICPSCERRVKQLVQLNFAVSKGLELSKETNWRGQRGKTGLNGHLSRQGPMSPRQAIVDRRREDDVRVPKRH